LEAREKKANNEGVFASLKMEESKRAKPIPEDDDSNTCSICLSIWTSHGEHQLCSLRCGHFFGYSCIVRALNMQNRNNRQCPLCNQKAKDSEIRMHFAVNKFTTRDVAKEEDLRSQLLQERAARAESELSAARAKTKVDSLASELKLLREQFQGTTTPVFGKHVQDDVDFIKVHAMTMNKARCGTWVSSDRGAAVACFTNERYKIALVHPEFSQRPSIAHGGEGHTLPIRDIAVQLSDTVCYGGTIATAAMDGVVSLISVANLNEVCRFTIGEPLFTVVFLSPTRLLVGTVKGKIFSLDPREPTSIPTCLANLGGEPVNALVPIDPNTVCAATFTRLVVVQTDGQTTPLQGMPPRVAGEQYSSVVGMAPGRIAISVRSPSESFVNIGSVEVQPHHSILVTQQRYRGLHGKPSGVVACLPNGTVFVPDEGLKKCVEYPSGRQLGTGDLLLTGAWTCGDSNYLMLIAQDQVQFVQQTKNL
jgi:hypothetical protein